MLFSSILFLFGFLPVVLGAYFLARSIHARNAVLLTCSLLFYAWGEKEYVVVLLGSITLNHFFGARIDGEHGGRRFWLFAAVASNLALLGAFKYAGFAVGTWNSVAPVVGMPAVVVPAIHLPLGISFFTFQALTYVVDVYRREVRPAPTVFHTALYISLFPQLVAGPIVRYGTLARELVERSVTRAGFVAGVERFVIGLAKKVLIANHLAKPADAIFQMPTTDLTAGLAWLGAVCYSLQIYFDFSGYSDMAIGLGRMFGLHFPENFNYPYVSGSIRDFWRRWHISLSTWFRDYLYIPLGGSRGSSAATARNLLVVFFLCGLWHGAAWTFVVWGLYHGSFLALERSGPGRRAVSGTPGWLRRVYVLVVVLVGWVIFRADDLGGTADFLVALVGLGDGDGLAHHVGLYLTPDIVCWLAVGTVASTPFAARLVGTLRVRQPAVDALLSPIALGALLLVSAAALAAGTYNPFIYFRF